MPISLLQLTAAYKPAYVYGGPTMSVAKLCEALVLKGTILEVFTTTANGQTELPVEANIQQLVAGVPVTYFKRLTKDHTHFSPDLLTALRYNITKNKRQPLEPKLVVHIHAWWNLVSLLSCALAKWYKIPVVLSPRGMLTNYTLDNKNTGFKALIHGVTGKKLLKYCHIHATSEKEKQDILKFIVPKSITVIPNLVDLPSPIDKPTLSINPSSSSFRLLFLSRVEEKKGLALLFDSLKLVNIDWKLTIAGTGTETYIESLKTRADELGLTNRIEWLGHVNNDQKFNLLAEHDLMVLTSYNENFANVVIESLSVGTPTLLSKEVGLASYVDDQDLGWITELSTVDISNKILLAYKAQEKRIKIRKIAPDLIATNFNSDVLAERYLTLYTAVTDGKL